MKRLKVIVIGAGSRGIGYTDIMKNEHDEKYEVIGVAEPIDNRREYMKGKHGIPEDMCFTDWKPLLEKGKIADLAIIATMDRDHFAPAMAAIELGYDLLLEKPITPTPEECVALTEAANRKGVKVIICTVLRYTVLFKYIKQVIESGRLGKVMNVTHREDVGHIHQSHSFVRGKWGNSQRSSTMLLQKSCHDIDILQWLLSKKCLKVQSFGELSHFTAENAPEGAPEYCVQGCPHGETCPYNAVKLYYEDRDNYWFRGAATQYVYPTDEQIMERISTTQYGKCVYKCDNDVVDHQLVNMLFEDDITVNFSMAGFSKGGRYIEVMGTKGMLSAAMKGESSITVFDFEKKEEEVVNMDALDGILGGHGGGDGGIVKTIYEYLTGTYEGNSVPEISESCYNHLITFAAEEARLSGKIVDVEEYIASLKK